MSSKRTYWFAFIVFGLSAAVGVALDFATGTADTGTTAAAAGAVVVAYGAVVTLRDPDHARFPFDWGLLEHGVATAGLYTAGVVFQLYAAAT